MLLNYQINSQNSGQVTDVTSAFSPTMDVAPYMRNLTAYKVGHLVYLSADLVQFPVTVGVQRNLLFIDTSKIFPFEKIIFGGFLYSIYGSSLNLIINSNRIIQIIPPYTVTQDMAINAVFTAFDTIGTL